MPHRRSIRRSHHSTNDRRWLKLLLVVAFLVPALIQTPVVPVRANELTDAVRQQQELDKLIAQQKKQLADIAAQQAKLQSQMASTQQSLDDLSLNVDVIQGNIDSLQGQVDQVHASYDELVSQESELQAELAQLVALEQTKQRELEDRQNLLARRLVAAYQTEQTPLLARLITARSLTDALSDVSYFLDLGAQDVALAEQIKHDQADLLVMQRQVEVSSQAVGQVAVQVELQKGILDQQMGDLTVARAKLLTMQNQLSSQIAAQQAANDKLAQNKAALAAAIAANGEASQRLAEKIAKLAAQGGQGRIPSQYSGQLVWPMGGKISQEFGCTGWPSEPRVGRCAHFHQGIDIVAPCMTRVRAAGSGEVMFVGYNPYDPAPRAWLVIIAHSTHLVTWYAHMTGRAPAGIYVGAQVSAGQLIGTENTTGHSTGCHLHWAVLLDGVFKNPRLFV